MTHKLKQWKPTRHINSNIISNENDKQEPQLHNKINKNQHHLNIENSDSEDEDASTRKSTNHHSLKQTIKDEIQDYVYHEDMTCKLKKSK